MAERRIRNGDGLTSGLSQLRVKPEMKEQLEGIAARRGIRRVADLMRHFMAQGIERDEAENGPLPAAG